MLTSLLGTLATVTTAYWTWYGNGALQRGLKAGIDAIRKGEPQPEPTA